jgi:hypothetical protein
MYHSMLHHPLLQLRSPPSIPYSAPLLPSPPTLPWPPQCVPCSGTLYLPAVQIALCFDLNFFVFIWLRNLLCCWAALLDPALDFSLYHYYYFHWTAACSIIIVVTFFCPFIVLLLFNLPFCPTLPTLTYADLCGSCCPLVGWHVSVHTHSLNAPCWCDCFNWLIIA